MLQLILTFILLAMLVRLAQRSYGRPKRRLALLLAATAFGCLALRIILTLLGVDLATFGTLLVAAPALLMLASLGLLALAWQTGELRQQIDRFNQEFIEERKRRTSDKR